MLKKSYPVSAYLKCIKKLKTPFPAASLKLFLSGYTSQFTRHTNLDNILFDGSTVTIKKVSGAIMSSQDINDMLMGLVLNHGPKTDIVSRFKFASVQFSKMHDRKDTPRSLTPPMTPTGIRNVISKKGKDTLKYMIDEVNENTSRVDHTDKIRDITENDVIDIIAASGLSVDVILSESDGIDLVSDVWLNYNGHVVITDFSTWNSLYPEPKVDDFSRLEPKVDDFSRLEPKGFGEMNSMNPDLLKLISSKFARIKTMQTTSVQPSSTPSPNILKTKESQINRIIKAKKEALVASSEKPDIQNNVRGMFSSLLPTHNTSLEVALNMFMGIYTSIKGVEKTGDHIYPSGRGAQFRWGIDSQYGDVILIMKPQFWKRYTKGISENGYNDPEITEGVTFNDFWASKQTKEKEITDQLNKEAKNFGFREPKILGTHCILPDDRKNLTWCNVQIHIGENVSIDDVDTVLVPRYLGTSRIQFKGVAISDIIFKAQYDQYYEIDGEQNLNPFYGKIVEYGPLDTYFNSKESKRNHPHYSIVLKSHRKMRDPIYDEILKGYTVVEHISDPYFEEIIKNGLHRSYAGGHSSIIGLSKIAYIDAVEEYMYRLLEHNMG